MLSIALPLALAFGGITPTQDADAFVPLFDGESLAGWSGAPGFWTVEDGEIVGRSTAENPCKRTTWLVWQGEDVADFELRCEVKLAGGNSGVQYRSRHLGEWQVHGPQADLDAAGQWTGGIYEQGARGVLVRRGVEQTREENHAMDTAIEGVFGGPNPVDASAWNTLVVRCAGDVSELWWNGVRTARLADTSAANWNGAGTIALQLHAGPPMEVRFRSVELKRLAPVERTDEAEKPMWIWVEGVAPGDEPDRATLRRTVAPHAAVTRATLWGTCDNSVEFFVDGVRVAASDDWTAAFERDVTDAFAGEGPFVLRAECVNEGGPAGLVARLTLEYADETREEIVTDGSWRSANRAKALVLAPLGAGPWGVPPTTSDGSPLSVLAPEALQLPPGFEAELLYEVPRDQGSWVAVETDDRGRIYCADERGRGLFRLTSSATGWQVEALGIDLPSAQGLLPLRRENGGLDLYVMVNAFGSERSNGLWRARDARDDGTFEELELLMPVDGAGEHGAHAIRRAPDGSGLYVIAGNHTKLPGDIAVYHAPTLWQEDQLLPRIPDPRGHAVGIPVPGGWFMKTDLDGGSRELVSIGMRNAYDFALDARGNVLTYDSDMEWDMGAPWYRAPRILQLEPGADFGWRNGSGKVPDWAEDTLGAVADTGPASPTGVVHTKDLAFHAPWDDVLLAADWAYGTVHAVTTRPRAAGGAELVGEVRTFIQGRPFPVTDLAAHPDGDLIVTIGGRGTRSAVYRIHSTVPEASRTVATPPDLVASRRDAPRSIASVDRVLRMRARVAGEKGAPPALGDEAEARALGAASLLVLAAQEGGLARRLETLERIQRALDRGGSAPVLLAQLRALEILFARQGAPDGAVRAGVLARLEPLYPSGERRVDRGLATLLTALGSETFTARAVARMLAADTQEDALHLALCLRVHRAGWTPELVDAYLTFLHVDARRFHGGMSLERYVETIRDVATERLSAESVSGVPGGWTPPAAAPVAASAPRIAGNTFVKVWSMADLRPRSGELEGRDLDSGRRAFQAARCAECHRFGGEGGATGPDLTGAGARYSPEDLLTALLEPSRDLTDQYQDTEVWTTDGVVHLGRVVEEDTQWLTLMPPPPDEGERIDVAQEEVKVRRPHPISRMPVGLLDGLRRAEALDLVAYLLAAPASEATDGAAPGGDDEAPEDLAPGAREASLSHPSLTGFDALRRAFVARNPGYDVHWHGAIDQCMADDGPRVVLVQSGEGEGTVVPLAGADTPAVSALRAGDIVVLRDGEVLMASGDLKALVFDVPAPPPADLPTFIRPDFDPRITDTPGGCAAEQDAYRRILLTWQGKVGPYLYHALNAHRVRIVDSFTHYHPVDGGFDEFYLVQEAPEGAELIVSERLDVLQGVAAVTRADVGDLVRRIPLRAGTLVYLPRGVVHRGVGGAVVQVITVPGFVPGAEIGVDDALRALNARFGLEADEALPTHDVR